MKVAFIGLGTMGLPMATRLADAGHEVRAWDVLEATRARVPSSSGSLAEAVNGAEAIVTMLPEGRDVAVVYKTGVFDNAGPGTLLIDCSTIDVETTHDLADRAGDIGCPMLDAPVSGGAEGAVEGQLSFMVGGPEDALAQAMPLLEAMGSNVTHFGDAGTGQAAKAYHNMICGITALGVCEAFALADALGLEAEKFFSLCQGAAAQSWIQENQRPVPGPAPLAPSSNGYAPGFAARLMSKDLRLAQAAAQSSGQETPFGRQAAERFTAFAEEGDGNLDFSAIYETIRKR